MRRIVLALCAAAAAAAPLVGARAADVRVLTNPAFRPVLDEVAPNWEKQTGNRVIIEQAIPADLLRKVAQGEPYDIVVANPPTLKRLEQDGKIGNVTTVAAVGISVAVHEGSPKPDISNVGAFKATLLAAKFVSMADPKASASSGNYMVTVFDRLGIADAMKPKIIPVYGGSAAEPVASGKADLGIQQASELFGWRGVTVVGPIPSELQQRTLYQAGLNPKSSDAARALHAALSGPETKAVLAHKPKGVEAP